MKVVILALLLTSSPLLAAKAPDLTPELKEKGKKSYSANCASCHGDTGDGNGPTGKYLTPKPQDFATGKFKQGDKLEQIFATITDGVKGNLMMASFKHMPEEERWALAYFVQAFRKTDTKKK